MIVTTVTVYVKKEYINDFIAITIENHNGAIQESGNIRFDFLQCSDDPTRFLLYEVYESEEAIKAHRETAHYKKWRETVTNWMAKPREAVKHSVIRPVDKSEW